MQAVILAAGKSTRTYPLTLTKPKALLKVANKEIIKHILDQLQGLVNEVILVVGYKADMVKGLLGVKYGSIRIRYVKQTAQLGTGDALMKAKPYMKDRFLVINGDDFVGKTDIETMLKNETSLLVKKVKNPENFGVVLRAKDGSINIVEKPNKFITDLANVACYLVDKSIFSYKKHIKKSRRGEIELTDFITLMSKDRKFKIVNSKTWMPVGFSWDLLTLNSHFLANIKKDIKGEVEKYTTLKGEVVVGKGTLIKNGAYIEGPVVIGDNCTIGPNCYIRPFTSIGNKCKIGNAVEVKNSIIGDNTNVGHLSYVGDSVLGSNVNFGAGTKVANLRHDNGNIKTPVKGKFVDTNRRKLGTICGDGVHTGINTSIYPGRKLFVDVETLPGEIVSKDKVE